MSAIETLTRTVASCGLAIACASAAAQVPTARQPAPGNIPAWPVITQQDMDRASGAVRMPGAGAPPASSTNVSALPKPQTQPPIDLAAVARGFEAAGTVGPNRAPAEPPLLVFVSLGMPETSLQRILNQAEVSKAVLVLRGLEEGSMQKTVARIQQLLGKRQVGFQIDPQAFDRFGVKAVPSFVLAAAGAPMLPCSAGQCFASDQFVMASGDVSIDYALEHFVRQAPRFAKQASRILSKLEAQ